MEVDEKPTIDTRKSDTGGDLYFAPLGMSMDVNRLIRLISINNRVDDRHRLITPIDERKMRYSAHSDNQKLRVCEFNGIATMRPIACAPCPLRRAGLPASPTMAPLYPPENISSK